MRFRSAGQDMLEHASRPAILAMMRLVIATADRFPAIAAQAGRVGLEAGRVRVRLAVEAGSDRPSDVEALVERFINLVFAPRQLRALLGERPEALLEQSPSRIEHAIAVLKVSGLLPRAT